MYCPSYTFNIQGMSSESQDLLTLGKNLKAYRKQNGLTQEQLSELCGFDPTYISMIERGKRNPAFLTLVKLAKNLSCRVSDLTKDI